MDSRILVISIFISLLSLNIAYARNITVEAQLYDKATNSLLTGNYLVNITLIDSSLGIIQVNEYNVTTDDNGRFFEYLNTSYNFSDKTYVQFKVIGYPATAVTEIGYVPKAISADLLNGRSDYAIDNSSLIKDFNTSWINQSGLILNWSTVNFSGGYDNTSWNESYANTLYAPIGAGSDNSSWNESYADTKFIPYVGANNDINLGDNYLTLNWSSAEYALNLWGSGFTFYNNSGGDYWEFLIDSNSSFYVNAFNTSKEFQLTTILHLLNNAIVDNNLSAKNLFSSNICYSNGGNCTFLSDYVNNTMLSSYANASNVVQFANLSTYINSSTIYTSLGSYVNQTMIVDYINATLLDNNTIVRSYNTSWVNASGLILNWSNIITGADNTSWNESYANTLYATHSNLNNNLSTYANMTLLSTYANQSTVNSNITSVYTALGGYVNQTMIVDYINATELYSNLSNYVNNTMLSGYANKSDLSTYANMTLLSTYINASTIYGSLATYANQSTVNTNVSNVYTALGGYVNMTNLGTYANKSELSYYVNQTMIADYINTTKLDNATIIRSGNTSWINISGLILNWSTIITSGSGGNTSGSGVANYLAKFSDTSNITLSSIIDTGSLVNITSNLSVGTGAEVFEIYDNATNLILNSTNPVLFTQDACYGSNCLSGINTSWNKTYADTLYAPLGFGGGDNSSWNQSLANTLYAAIGVGADNSSWNESYARTLFPTNASALAYVNASGMIKNWNESGTIKNYNDTGLIINWSVLGSGFATHTNVNTNVSAIYTELGNYVNNSMMATYVNDSDLSTYANQSTVNSNITSVYTALNSYVNQTMIADYINATELYSNLSNYVNNTMLSSYVNASNAVQFGNLSTYANQSTVDSNVTAVYNALGGYVNMTNLGSYANKSDLSTYANQSTVNSNISNVYTALNGYVNQTMIANYINATELYSNLSNYVNNTMLSSYANASNVVQFANLSTYANQSTVNTNISNVYTALSGYVNNTMLAGYANKSDLSSYVNQTMIADYINATLLDNNTIVRSYNTSWVNASGLILNWSDIISSGSDNTSWNESYANTLYATHSNLNNNLSTYANMTLLSTYANQSTVNANITSVYNALGGYVNQTMIADYINTTKLDNATIIRSGNTSWINSTGLLINWSTVISGGDNTSWNESYADTKFIPYVGANNDINFGDNYLTLNWSSAEYAFDLWGSGMKFYNNSGGDYWEFLIDSNSSFYVNAFNTSKEFQLTTILHLLNNAIVDNNLSAKNLFSSNICYSNGGNCTFLSDYVNNTMLSSYVNASNAVQFANLSTYANQSTVNSNVTAVYNALASYVNQTMIVDYINATELYSNLSNYVNNTMLSSYVNASNSVQFGNLSTYANQSTVNSNVTAVYNALGGYVNMTNLGSYANMSLLSTYANMTLLSTYINASTIYGSLATYANQSTVNTNVSNVYTALGGYVNMTNLGTYANRSELSSYVNQTMIANYINATELYSNLSNYVNNTMLATYANKSSVNTSGTGTINYLAKFKDSANITNSSIIDNGTLVNITNNVSIGTGSVVFEIYDNTSNLIFNSTNNVSFTNDACYGSNCLRHRYSPLLIFQTSDINSTSSTGWNNTAMIFTIANSKKYHLICDLMSTSAAATTGLSVNLTANATTTNVYTAYSTWSNGTNPQTLSATSLNSSLTGTGSNTATVQIHKIQSYFETTAAGNLSVVIRSEVAASAITLLRGSSCTLYDLT